jgi:hypothetical protein
MISDCSLFKKGLPFFQAGSVRFCVGREFIIIIGKLALFSFLKLTPFNAICINKKITYPGGGEGKGVLSQRGNPLHNYSARICWYVMNVFEQRNRNLIVSCKPDSLLISTAVLRTLDGCNLCRIPDLIFCILTKYGYCFSRKNDLGCSSRIRIQIFSFPDPEYGSWIQGSKKHRILDPDPQQ